MNSTHFSGWIRWRDEVVDFDPKRANSSGCLILQWARPQPRGPLTKLDVFQKTDMGYLSNVRISNLSECSCIYMFVYGIGWTCNSSTKILSEAFEWFDSLACESFRERYTDCHEYGEGSSGLRRGIKWAFCLNIQQAFAVKSHWHIRMTGKKGASKNRTNYPNPGRLVFHGRIQWSFCFWRLKLLALLVRTLFRSLFPSVNLI